MEERRSLSRVSPKTNRSTRVRGTKVVQQHWRSACCKSRNNPEIARGSRMKRAIVLLACGILGGISGYLIAPFASMGFVRSTEPKLFGAFMFSLVDRSIVCSCESEPPGEAVKKLMSDLSSLEKWQGQNEKSDVLAQEIGLTEVRLSRVERDLSRNAEAD